MSEPSLVVRNASIVDGTGAPAYQGSVSVAGERIAAVGPAQAGAVTTIDASGLAVCPGFIDAHSHADSSILACPTADNLVMQGITTFVGGNCGQSLAPLTSSEHLQRSLANWGVETPVAWRTFSEWLAEVGDAGLSVNYAPLVGHNTVREAAMGADSRRPASAEEVERMRGHVAEALEAGAFGLSAGFDAAWSGHFACADEIVALARVAAEYGGFFAPHTKHHQNQWPARTRAELGYGVYHGPAGEIITGRYHGLLEAVEFAKRAKAPLQIAHLTPAYIIPQPHPSFLDEAAARATLVDIIDRALDDGLEVTFTVIPWRQTVGRRAFIADSFIGDGPFLPRWLTRLSGEDLADHLDDPQFRSRVRAVVDSGTFKFGMVHPLTDPYWMDCFTVIECSAPGYAGRTIGDIVREREPSSIVRAVYEVALETLFDIVALDPHATWAFTLDKREYGALATFLRHPAAMPCSDVQAYASTGQPVDALFGYAGAPIAYGLFPHYLREFVRERHVLSLEEAVKKATLVPARQLLGLMDRGVIEPGAHADLVVLDPDTVAESGDFLKPARAPRGIRYVIVNGRVVWDGTGHTGERPGRVLRRP